MTLSGLGAAERRRRRLADGHAQGVARLHGLRPLRRHRHATARAATSSSAPTSTSAAPAALASNTWTHLAATYDGANLRLYVNGTQVATRAVTGSMRASTGALRIGGNSTWGEWFGGLIDDVRIYNRALTPSEVQADMNTPVA